jgi:hypothetical protein
LETPQPRWPRIAKQKRETESYEEHMADLADPAIDAGNIIQSSKRARKTHLSASSVRESEGVKDEHESGASDAESVVSDLVANAWESVEPTHKHARDVNIRKHEIIKEAKLVQPTGLCLGYAPAFHLAQIPVDTAEGRQHFTRCRDLYYKAAREVNSVLETYNGDPADNGMLRSPEPTPDPDTPLQAPAPSATSTAS